MLIYGLSLETIREFLEIEGLLYEEDETEQIDSSTIRAKIWNLFEYPESSFFAKILSLISVLAIITSTSIFCLETLPDPEDVPGKGKRMSHHTSGQNGTTEVPKFIIGHHHVCSLTLLAHFLLTKSIHQSNSMSHLMSNSNESYITYTC